MEDEEINKIKDKVKRAKLRSKVIITTLLSIITLYFVWYYFTIK